jgi:hypothetical protein
MISVEDLFGQEAGGLHWLGLTEISFREGFIGLDSEIFRKIFTGPLAAF